MIKCVFCCILLLELFFYSYYSTEYLVDVKVQHHFIWRKKQLINL